MKCHPIFESQMSDSWFKHKRFLLVSSNKFVKDSVDETELDPFDLFYKMAYFTIYQSILLCVYTSSTTMASLRHRPTKSSPTRTTPSRFSKDRDPSSKEKRPRRRSHLPIAGVILFSGLLFYGGWAWSSTDDHDAHRSLQAVLGLRRVAQYQGPVDYEKLPLCINHYDDLPELWRPPKMIDSNGNPKRLFMDDHGEPQASKPWTEQETQLADRALHQALDEAIRYYRTEMTTEEVIQFQPDGINSLLDMVYSQKGNFHDKALKEARAQFVLVASSLFHEEYDDESEDNNNNNNHQNHEWKDEKEGDDEDEKEGDDEDEDNDKDDGEEDETNKELEVEPSNETNENEQEDEKNVEEGTEDEGEEREVEANGNEDEASDETNEGEQETNSNEEEDEADKVNEDEDVDATDDDVRRRLREETDDNPMSSEKCQQQYLKMKMVDFGHYIVEQYGRETVRDEDPVLEKAYRAVVTNVQEMIKSCKTLDRILDVKLTFELFEDPEEDSDVVFDYLLSAIALVELQTIPDIDLPKPEVDWFVANLWRYFATYKLKYARDNPRHYWDPDTIGHAWLATHIAYLPSGYGRHSNQVEDAPYLYQYIRENFYYAMEYGRIDLVSEFVDLIRTYGCSEETDYQLRDGTRFVMKQFSEEMEGQWIDRESPDSHYNKIHIPWAGSAAVLLSGSSEPIIPGSYGFAFNSILKNHRQIEPTQIQMNN